MIDQKLLGIRCPVVLGAVLILTAGGLFVAWLADINIDKGIGGQKLVYRSRSIDEHPSYVNFGTKQNPST